MEPVHCGSHWIGCDYLHISWWITGGCHYRSCSDDLAVRRCNHCSGRSHYQLRGIFLDAHRMAQGMESTTCIPRWVGHACNLDRFHHHDLYLVRGDTWWRSDYCPAIHGNKGYQIGAYRFTHSIRLCGICRHNPCCCRRRINGSFQSRT